MAFQTLTSSSDTFLSTPIPSATSQSSTLPTLPDSPNPTGSNSNGNGANFFSPTTSPPLILAFLAIGLFSVAMIAMFGWRRIQYGRGWAAHLRDDDELTGFGPSGTRGTRGLGRGGLYGEPWFGEKPKLWDLWAEKRTGLSRTTAVAVGADSKEAITTSSVRDEDIRWDNIMPLSFGVDSLNGESSQDQEQRTFGGVSDVDVRGFQHMRLRSLQSFRLPSGLVQSRQNTSTPRSQLHSIPPNPLSRYFVRHHHRDARTSDRQDPVKLEMDEAEPVRCSRVSVIVAMPSRVNPSWIRADDTRPSIVNASRIEETLEYAIGVYCPT